MAGIRIGHVHLQRLGERVGREWARERDADIGRFRRSELVPEVASAPAVAAVMLDGGRAQVRADGQGPGVHGEAWAETKVACCLSLSSKEWAADPQPEPPAKLLDPAGVARLAAELKARAGAAPLGKAAPAGRGGPAPRRRRKKARRKDRRPRKLVRTVVASMASSDEFGWQVAAEVHRRRLGEAGRKACVCDGQKWNWAVFAMHLLPLGFVAILDIIHLVAYLHGAARAAAETAEGVFPLYERWLRLAWAGEAEKLHGELVSASQRLGEAPAGAKDDDPRKVLAEAAGHVGNNKGRMRYADYRKQGLPIGSAPVESAIKQVNQRIKGTEKFWLRGGAEAILQVRAAYLSEDGRAERYWKRKRPRGRAVGERRLNQ